MGEGERSSTRLSARSTVSMPLLSQAIRVGAVDGGQGALITLSSSLHSTHPIHCAPWPPTRASNPHPNSIKAPTTNSCLTTRNSTASSTRRRRSSNANKKSSASSPPSNSTPTTSSTSTTCQAPTYQTKTSVRPPPSRPGVSSLSHHPLPSTTTPPERQYRKKSLLIHPDKLKHPRGIEAFDLLKKARPSFLPPSPHQLTPPLSTGPDRTLRLDEAQEPRRDAPRRAHARPARSGTPARRPRRPRAPAAAKDARPGPEGEGQAQGKGDHH